MHAMTATETLAAIETLKTKALKETLAELTGKPVRSNNRPYLLRALTKALEPKVAEEAAQARAAAAQARAVQRRRREPSQAEEAAPAKRTRRRHREPGQRDPRLPAPGTVLTREYQGKTIRVTVLEDGFRYAGKTYRSLSTIAKEATGTIWNGLLFFRLIPHRKREAAAA
jgi:hypothetical protein